VVNTVYGINFIKKQAHIYTMIYDACIYGTSCLATKYKFIVQNPDEQDPASIAVLIESIELGKKC
jgi:hypothetical protein